MIETSPLYRPGLTAIAAVLALSSTSGMAQVALPDVGAPAAPLVAAPPAAQAAPVQTVQNVPAAPTLPDIAVTDTPAQPGQAPTQAVARPQVRSASGQIAARAATSATPAEQTKNVAPVSPRAMALPPVATPVPQADVSARESATPAPVVRDVTPTGQSRAEAKAADDMGYAGWVLLGGGLLIVAGGAAFAMSRRPKRREDIGENPMVYKVPVAPIMPEAAIRETEPGLAVRPSVEEPRRPRVAVLGRNIGDGAGDDRHALLEAMIAEEPSEANPFHSRRNRLRRADFLLRTGQVQDRVATPAEQNYAEPSSVSDRWSEMRFGGNQSARVSWKRPITTR